MPMVAERELAIVVGGPYSSGALVGGPNFEYAPAPPEILDKVARIKAIADRYGISMKAAGLQFALANPVVAAVIPGASRPSRIAEDRAALEESIPADFWRDLRSEGLVNPAAPSCGRLGDPQNQPKDQEIENDRRDAQRCRNGPPRPAPDSGSRRDHGFSRSRTALRRRARVV